MTKDAYPIESRTHRIIKSAGNMLRISGLVIGCNYDPVAARELAIEYDVHVGKVALSDDIQTAQTITSWEQDNGI